MKINIIIFLYAFFCLNNSFVFGQKKKIFEENFDNNINKWKIADSTDYKFDIENGKYKIDIKKKQVFRWTILSNDVTFIDPTESFVIETTLTQTNGDPNVPFGMIWAAKDERNMYAFLINSNGNYAVMNYKRGRENPVCIWRQTQNIKPKEQSNNLKISYQNYRTVFYINNQEVFSIEEQIPFFGNLIGFEIKHGISIEADNFYISQDVEINLVEGFDSSFKKKNLGKSINSECSEILPRVSFDGKTLYFYIGDSPKNIGENVNGDVWYSERINDTTWSERKNIGKPINNKFNNYLVSISPDNNTLFLTTQNSQFIDPRQAGIAVSHRKKDGWSEPRQINIENFYNKNKFGEFCLSADSKVLIQTIERDDTFGDQDLYISFLQNNEKWSEPMNMGQDINTFGSENSPFLAADGVTLFYSTNGKAGYGSNDIFITRRLDESWLLWSEPQNLGKEINTSDWDAYYTLPASGDYAYFVSAKEGFGQEDIFSIPLPQSLKPKAVVMLKGKVINTETKQPMKAEIIYSDLEYEKEIGYASSNPKDGSYKIILKPGLTYGFRANKKQFIPINENIDLHGFTDYTEIEQNLYLTPIKKGTTVRLNNIFFETGKANLQNASFHELNRLSAMLKEYPKMKIEIAGHTDNVGTSYSNQILSKNRADAVRSYLLSREIDASKVVSKGYGETKPQTTNKTEEGKKMNRRVEFTILDL